MTGHDRAFANARPLDDYRLPATSAEFRHWFAETVMTDAPLGSAGMNAHLSRLAESIDDRRARTAIESGICTRRAILPEADRRHRRRAW